MFGKEGIEKLPPEKYSAALLDTIVTGWSLENTLVAVLQDWMKGRRAETEDINGRAVVEAKRLGKETPVNERLVELGRQIEAGTLEPKAENADLLRRVLDF
jgi:2-dehydropantoate 2-reductase